MKVGLLGAGRMGTLHAGILRDHPRVDELWVYDPVGERARELAGAVGASVAPSEQAVLTTCDAVVVATSSDSHADDVVAAARAGTAALCEKPLAQDLRTATTVVDEVERAGIPAQVGFNRRFDAGLRAARRAVEDGSLGQLLLVVGQHHDHRPPPDEYVPVSGGQFKDQLIHDFDLLRFLTGDEVVRVHAAATPRGFEVFARHDDSAVTVVTLWLRGGAVAVLCGVRTDPVGYDVRMELFGTGDSIVAGLDGRTPLRSVEPGQQPPVDPYREWLPRFGPSYAAQADAFLTYVAEGGPSPCSVHDGRAALAIAEACDRSAASGAPVELGVAA